METPATSSLLSASMTLGALRAAGVVDAEIAAALGLDEALLAQPEARVPNERLVPLWDWASERLGDEALGLHLAQRVDRDSFDVFSFIAGSSSSLGAALDCIGRYFRLLTDAAVYELAVDGEAAWWSFGRSSGPAAGPSPGRHQETFALAASVAYSRLWLGDDFAPEEVFFRHDDRTALDEIEAYFRAPVHLSAEQCAFRFGASHLERPLDGADSGLASLLRRYADEALAALGDHEATTQQVRRCVLDGLAEGGGSLDDCARRLAVSSRSLQRRLRDEGTTHKEILDQVRREMAVRYLSHRDLTASQVAFLLGFSETAPFFRAFKRWTGRTPGEYREHLAP